MKSFLLTSVRSHQSPHPTALQEAVARPRVRSGNSEPALRTRPVEVELDCWRSNTFDKRVLVGRSYRPSTRLVSVRGASFAGCPLFRQSPAELRRSFPSRL